MNGLKLLEDRPLAMVDEIRVRVAVDALRWPPVHFRPKALGLQTRVQFSFEPLVQFGGRIDYSEA